MGVACMITELSGRGLRYMGGVKSGIKAVWAGPGLESALRGRGQDCNQGCMGVAGDAWAGSRMESRRYGRGLGWNQGNVGGAWTKTTCNVGVAISRFLPGGRGFYWRLGGP